MSEKCVKIKNSIEARDVALIVQTASLFASSIKIHLDEKSVNAKSIMGLIALGDLDGKELKVCADGVDAEEAVKKLADFLSK